MNPFADVRRVPPLSIHSVEFRLLTPDVSLLDGSSSLFYTEQVVWGRQLEREATYV